MEAAEIMAYLEDIYDRLGDVDGLMLVQVRQEEAPDDDVGDREDGTVSVYLGVPTVHSFFRSDLNMTGNPEALTKLLMLAAQITSTAKAERHLKVEPGPTRKQ